MKYIVLFLVRTFLVILNIIFLPLRLVLSILGFSFQERKFSYPEKKDFIKLDLEGEVANINYDNLTEEDQEEFRKVLIEEMDFPRYDGEVEHAYELTSVKDPKTCPRCQSETQQCYANFIYATQVAPRVMFGPAGFFCLKCPTVVIDHEMIQQGVDKKFQFKGVVGIDYDKKNNIGIDYDRDTKTDFFKTWNGKQTTYIFDEDQNLIGLSTSLGRSHAQRSKKRKKRKKIAKQSRKKNRGKK